MQTLAAAAEQAHRSGVAMSIDHPSRVRVSIEGDVALAFPATMPDATPEDDIRGIGAALYALLINRWPLDGVRGPQRVGAGRGRRRRRAGRAPVDRPRHPVPDLGRGRALGAGGWRHPQRPDAAEPAAAGHRCRRPHRADQSRRRVRGAGRNRRRVRGKAPDEPEAAARRRKGLIVGLSVGAAILVVALIVLASVLKGIFGDVGGFSQDELGLSAPTTSAEATVVAEVGATVKPVKATVFSPEGEADAPDQAPLAIDGNTSTVWPIDTYSDPVPFPNFKNGVGLMLQLPQPTTVGEVTIDLNSTGTSVEIRSAQTPTPSSLSDTTVLTPATPLKPGSNTIKVDNASPTSNLLVWVSTLGQVNGESRSDIAEITVKAAS